MYFEPRPPLKDASERKKTCLGNLKEKTESVRPNANKYLLTFEKKEQINQAHPSAAKRLIKVPSFASACKSEFPPICLVPIQIFGTVDCPDKP